MDKYRIPIKIDKTVHYKDVKESTQNHNPDSLILYNNTMSNPPDCDSVFFFH
jgi:hypothetical protein